MGKVIAHSEPVSIEVFKNVIFHSLLDADTAGSITRVGIDK